MSMLSLRRSFALLVLVVPPGCSLGGSNDLEVPQVDVVNPQTGSAVVGTVAIGAEASDDIAVTKVKFYIDGEEVGEDDSEPFEYPWDTSEIADGSHEIMAVAFDAAGNEGVDDDTAVTVANHDAAAPTVSITNPTDGTQFQQGVEVTVVASATDDTQVARVDFFVDGASIGSASQSPYQVAWTAATIGDYVLSAKAYDAIQNEGVSSPVSIAVRDSGWVSPPKRVFGEVAGFPLPDLVGDPEAFKTGPNPGHLRMFLYVPENLPQNAPLVVAFHGCNQAGAMLPYTDAYMGEHNHAEWYMRQSGWTKMADQYKFYLVFPEQIRRSTMKPEDANLNQYQANGDFVCFAWAGFYGNNMGRGMGEGQSILEMIDWVQSQPQYSVDGNRLFVTGMSAGGSMAMFMAAMYPDVFAGAASNAGVSFYCANYAMEPGGPTGDTDPRMKEELTKCMGITEHFQPASPEPGDSCSPSHACMSKTYRERTPAQLGGFVRDYGYQGYSGAYPRIMAWQGTADEYVDSDSLNEIMEQWTDVHGIDQTADNGGSKLKDGNAQHTYREYQNADGEPLVAIVEMPSMTHGMPVDPGSGEEQGGSTEHPNSYSYPWGHDKDIFASYHIAEFWGLADGTPPTGDEPTVAITSPETGACYASGETVSIAGTASAPVGATIETVSVEVYTKPFYGEPQLVESGDATGTESWTYDLDTGGLTLGGTYTIEAMAVDSEAHESSVESIEISYSYFCW